MTLVRRSHSVLRGLLMTVVIGAGAGWIEHPAAQTSVGTADPFAEGRALFNTYCASCHGITGVGNGPAAPAMRRPPPDITGLAAANGGTFPAERVHRIVEGRDVEAHGDRDMPVWGDVFKSGREARGDGARERIAAIVEYLHSIQRHRA